MQHMPRHPKTVQEAVEMLAASLPEKTLHLIRGGKQSDLIESHFGLGMWIRNELGLWKDGSELLRSCGATHADSGSSIILNALRDHLVRTATPEELAASREVRREHEMERDRQTQAHLDAIAAKDAAITDKRCPCCGKPCPRYRKTCKHCGKAVRVGNFPRSGG
jgi:hypothetical protein